MLRTRVIPSLLLSEGGLVKTRRFKDPVYIGDPINAVRIFNDKGADELAFLDISATRRGTGPDFAVLEDIASEAFMPFSYGGGITSVAQVKRLYSLGIEKVVINTGAVDRQGLVTEAATLGGSSGVVASMDVKRDWRGRFVVMVDGGRRHHKADVVAHAQWLAEQGAGEILLNAIDRDGMMEGYDLDLIGRVSRAVTVPVVAVGGAGSVADFALAVTAGAAAVSAGSLFVFHGRQRGVLITYPEPSVLQQVFG